MMKKIIFIIIPLLCFILFDACDSDNDFNSDSYIRDDAGNVFPNDFIPKRIISLAPNISETIYALNADSLLVGVTDYCDFPPEVKKKEKVGSLLDPNIEKITSLAPDLIFMTTEGNSKYTYLSLKSNGFKVYVTNPNDINGINRMVINIGVLLGKKDNGQKIADKISDSKKYYTVEKENNKTISSFLIISLNPLITVNKFTYISELMDLSGFENIYKDELLEYPNVNYEDVFLKNPDCIFFLCDTANSVLVNETISEVKNRLSVVNAVKNNKIFAIDENIFSRPGPRVMEGVKLLHSKVF
jgi:iron complex transport system substrate-binding protein